MKLSRRQALVIHYFLDQLIPPVLRDADWFMLPMFHLLFGKKASIFAEWKDRAPAMSDAAFAQAYREVEDVLIERTTSLNKACLLQIRQAVTGSNLLEVGCGNGYLSSQLTDLANVTGLDIIIHPETHAAHPNVIFKEGNMQALPFPDATFDTVVSTHTLEHVKDLPAAMRELRRVTRQRLILVTPRQRPYKYTFDLHLNFFPYPHSLVQAVGRSMGPSSCQVVGGDLFYIETCPGQGL
jgi:ubiquinone/menaquinone biosynthesis C-methylase UbiE